MRVTEEVIRGSCFETDLKKVTEISFANKDIDDLGSISLVENTQDLNIAFNSLTSIRGLEALTKLKTLNAMHNAIKAPGLKALGDLPALRVLRLSHNKLKSLAPLAACPNLEELWVQHNDFKDVSELEALRPLQKLERLAFFPNGCAKKMPPKEYRLAVKVALPNLKMLDGQEFTAEELAAPDQKKPSSRGERSILGSNGRQSPLPLPASGRRSGRAPLGENHCEDSPPSTDEKGAGERLSSAPVYGRRARRGMLDASPGSTASGEGMGGALAAVMSTPSHQGKPAEGRPPRAPSSGMGLGGSLGRSDSIAGGGDRSGSGSRPGTAPRNPEEVIMEYTAGYAPGIKAKGNGDAISVRGDGGAWAKWPNEALAISVDGEGGPGQRSQRYRLFAAYRDTGMVAASFDPGGGGFVNWPSGHLCFVYTAETGSGTVYDNTGNPTTTWSDANGDPLSESVEVLLDSHMGFRFKVPEKRVEMYFACHNVRHRFVNCFNRAKASWPKSDDIDAPRFVDQLEATASTNSSSSKPSSFQRPDARALSKRSNGESDQRFKDLHSATENLKELDIGLSKRLLEASS
ncbi:hypothetical protein CYMTET_25978 [Cymbomonas tetramitiformis]|uniref:Uncharacterized protein n=1 Tax=Cymbomonas tetramitiformis TaxID=36881 RepID=A0AAE0FTI3_9CHLO|nr:hypothetical protein CYMTET_25978 [Cymbomonas tetramitiformis]